MTPSITVDGVNYFAIAAAGCDIMVEGRHFVCACHTPTGGCSQPVGASACTPKTSDSRLSIIHLTKEQYILAAMLGAEVPT